MKRENSAMRHLFVAALMVFGALLIVLVAANVLQEWQIAQGSHWNGPAIDEAQLPSEPAPKTAPAKLTAPSQRTVTAAREGAY
jgi:hypothetical protein